MSDYRCGMDCEHPDEPAPLAVDKPICQSCRFWHLTPAPQKPSRGWMDATAYGIGYPTGECRRNPSPAYSKPDYGCGEFQRADDPAARIAELTRRQEIANGWVQKRLVESQIRVFDRAEPEPQPTLWWRFLRWLIA